MLHAKSPQSCPTLCDPMDYSPSDSMSMGFSRQEYCSGLPCHPLGDLPDPGIEPTSLMSPALAPTGSTHWLNSSLFIWRENNSFEIFQESSGKFQSTVKILQLQFDFGKFAKNKFKSFEIFA